MNTLEHSAPTTPPAIQAKSQLQLEDILGRDFAEKAMYRLALTHPSFANEQKSTGKAEHNERLELLGDSVLGLCITEYLYRNFPQRNEGKLSKLKSYIVSAESLAQAAREHQLGPIILLGKGESRDSGRDKESVLANAVEALIGACYLERGFEQSRKLVLCLLAGQLARYQHRNYSPQDAKLQVQEYVQKHYKSLPQYETLELFARQNPGSGEARAERASRQSCGFVGKLFINGEFVSQGHGSSKKEAEKQAAMAALAQIFQNEENE